MEENEVRNELTPKYRGAYDKAKTGHSPKSAIQVACLKCMVCKTKDIRDCENANCEFHQYRPYRKLKKKKKRLQASNLPRAQTGQFAKTPKKYPQAVSKVIEIESPPEGRIRLKVEILPEKENKGDSVCQEDRPA